MAPYSGRRPSPEAELPVLAPVDQRVRLAAQVPAGDPPEDSLVVFERVFPGGLGRAPPSDRFTTNSIMKSDSRLFPVLLITAALPLGSCSSHQAHLSDHVDWTYSGAKGPEHWGELGAGFTACCHGVTQSPIDLRVDREGSHELELHYSASHELLVNNGHTIQMSYDGGAQLLFDGTAYNLLQFHFHTPSEHHVEGAEFAMEAHLVHLSAENEYLVVSILFEQGDPNPFLDTIVADAPSELGAVEKNKTLDVSQLLPRELGFYLYAGSFTTPPCTDGVTWLVLDRPAHASVDQIQVLADLEGQNNRPMQTRGERVVEHFSN